MYYPFWQSRRQVEGGTEKTGSYKFSLCVWTCTIQMTNERTEYALSSVGSQRTKCSLPIASTGTCTSAHCGRGRTRTPSFPLLHKLLVPVGNLSHPSTSPQPNLQGISGLAISVYPSALIIHEVCWPSKKFCLLSALRWACPTGLKNQHKGSSLQ